MKLTAAQSMMVKDGLPKTCFMTSAQRAAVWEKNPPKPPRQFIDPRTEQQKQMLEQLKKEANRKRDAHLSNLKAKKQREKLDTTGMRWDSRRNKWEPLHTKEERQMPKLNITPYNEAGEIIQRGVTTVDQDAGDVQVYAKIGAAFHRCPKDSVMKITVTNEAGEFIREWDNTQDVPPKPASAAKPVVDDKAIKKAKAKGEKRIEKAKAKSKPAAAGKKAPPRKAGEGKGPGVIATILEVINRDQGGTLEEILAVLTKRFPDREPKGMTATIRIQANRHCKAKDKDEKRGLIYYGKGKR